MNGKRMAGAVAGGLIAGLGITAMMIAGEKKQGTPSELADLERTTLRKLGMDAPPADQLPGANEQLLIQGGHLLLSVVAGASYAATFDKDDGVISSGVKFGLAFYVLAHWVTGPLLGIKLPEWQSAPKVIGMHTVNHVVFGLVTAIAAKAAG